ncbi:MAG: archease [Candidatus Bathyarchaeota archaeon]|nr:MAG: archease [Candidatus Bathyarchaeota archaeon]
MATKKRFEFLEHTGDAYIAAYGKTLEEAFENAALATFEVMTDVDKVEPRIEDDVEVEAHDEQALLYNWLERLLVKFDLTDNLYSRFKILTVEREERTLKLKAKIWGEPLNLEKHPRKVGVKAVTYHRMEILKKPRTVIVRFILDI